VKVTERQINRTITEVTAAMANDEWPTMVEGLRQLAVWWRSVPQQAGMRTSFAELCQYMESEAVKMSGTEMTRTRVRAALQEAKKDRIVSGICH
jgi:hypothetical protein